MSARYGILDDLAENWPGKFSPQRVAFFERRTRDFSESELKTGVDLTVETFEYPPVIAQLRQMCRRARGEEAREGGEVSLIGLRPGQEIPWAKGEHFMTSDQAQIELDRMEREYPEAFDTRIKARTNSTPFDMITIHRIYIKALHHCIRLDGKPLKKPSQERLF